MIRFLFTYIFIFTIYISYSQIDTLISSNFNGCTVGDVNRNIIGSYNGNIFSACTSCGVDDIGLELNGADNIEYSNTLDLNSIEEFTMSFYILPTNRTGIDRQELISHRMTCDRDSSFFIRYTPVTTELTVEFAVDNQDVRELTAFLDVESCWYHVTITHNLNFARIYVNDVLQDEVSFVRPFIFSKQATLKIGDSPCVGTNIGRFEGLIDEFLILNYFSDESEVIASNVRMDDIISRDTTIFEGESVDIKTGPSCADDIKWSPFLGLSDSTLLAPVATPDTSTTYLLTLDYGSCVTQDSIRISVVDENVSCTNLLLPNAFTPNGDGVNDEYGISSIFLIEELITFEIFDKWGSLMFVTSEKEGKWDGNFGGKSVDPGMYLYKIRYTCKGAEQINTGSFAVVN